MRRAALFSLGLAAVAALVGCEASSDVSPVQDKQIRNNFSRSLTPDEVAQMGGGKKDASSGAQPPKKGPK